MHSITKVESPFGFSARQILHCVAKAFTLEGVHIPEVFSYCKGYKWNRYIMFTIQYDAVRAVLGFLSRYFTVRTEDVHATDVYGLKGLLEH